MTRGWENGVGGAISSLEEKIAVCQLYQMDLFERVPVGHGFRSTSELVVVVGHVLVILTKIITYSVDSLG
jgi:hypothetical protein